MTNIETHQPGTFPKINSGQSTIGLSVTGVGQNVDIKPNIYVDTDARQQTTSQPAYPQPAGYDPFNANITTGNLPKRQLISQTERKVMVNISNGQYTQVV